MPVDNEEPTNSLSDRANLHLSEDEARTAGVVESLRDPYKWGKASPQEQADYTAYRDKYGQRASEVQLDRSLPVGQGEGFRNATNWRDHQAKRMFRLDQGMADQDEARSPTMESIEASWLSTEYLNHALEQTQLLDPEYAYELALADRFLVMYPELAVTTRSGLGFAGITEQLGAEIMGVDLPSFAAQADQSFLQQSDIGDEVYNRWGDTFDPATKDMILINLAGLSEREQKRHWGLMAAYLDARPLQSLEDQIEFVSWLSGSASATYAVENDQSFWGKFGRVGAHVFTKPADWFQDEVLGSLWTSASDGADSWYRKELQLEETMAISLGHEVGTTGWQTFTGLAGMGIDVIIDPTNILLGGLAGYKAVKTAAMIDDAVRNTSRFSRVARQFVPFGSRSAARAIGLPTGVRGRSSRILWTAFAKTNDGLVEVARKKGVFNAIAAGSSYSGIIEQIPELKNVDVGLVQALLRRTDPAEVEALYSAGLRGSLLDPHSMAHTDILANEIDAQGEVTKLLSDLNPTAYTAGDIAAANGGGMYHNLPVRLNEGVNVIDDILEGGADAVRAVGRIGERALESNVGRAMDPNADGIVSFIVKGDTQLVNLNPGTKGFNDAVEWVSKNTRYKNKGMRADGTMRKDAMQAYMRATNKDVATVNGNAVFADLAKMKADGKIMDFQGGLAGHSGLADASQKLKVAAYERRMVTPKADAVSKWVISDMPTKVRSARGDFRFWNRQFGVFSGAKYSEANFLVRKARGLVASVFIDDIPPRIATGWANRQDGVQDLRRLLVQMNVDPNLARRSVDSYLEDPSQGNVLRILRDAGEDIGDPELTLGLMRFNQKNASEMEYAVINNSEQLTSGRRVDGSEGLQPLIPSQTRQYVQLPDQKAFSAHIRRTKRAQTRVFKHRNRGWGDTRVRRTEVADEFGRSLKKGSEEEARWLAMTQDEKMAVAYATVRPKDSTLGDGLGMAARFGQTSGESWARLRNAFSVSMLAWRPIGWMGNEMLDNSWRAAMADGLSFFTHPFRSMEATHDAINIRKADAAREAYQEATRPIRAIVQANRGKDPDDLLKALESVIPSIRQHVDLADDMPAQAAAVRKFVDTEMLIASDAVPVLDDPLAAALLRQRKGQQARQKYDLPSGLEDHWDVDWDDISRTGMEQNFTQEVASASGRHQYRVGERVSPELLDDYSRALGNVWARDLRDPVIRMYLDQVARVGSGGTDGSSAARTFVNSGSWNLMEEPVRNMARFDGQNVDAMTDLDLAAWYFKNKISPYVDDIFGDALHADNVAGMRSGRFITEVNGKVMHIDVDDPASIADVVRAANGTPYVLPRSVVGVVNPRNVFGYGKETNGWRTPLKSYNQWALNKFGHEIPAKYQRNPAFITAFSRFKKNYVRLGMTDEGANFAANQKAMEHINKTFFFVEAQTPFLKKMNEVMPFFAAQYEIIKAWTWNIPAAQGGAGIGHARMLRTYDHIFTSMRENGLLVPRYNRQDGSVEGWDLQFAQDPHTDNIVGRTLSQAGHLGMMAPFILVEQLAEIITQTDMDLTPEEIRFKFNHPYEFFGKGGGVLPTARMQMGMNPAMALPVDALIKRMPFTSTSNADVVKDEKNLEVYLLESDTVDRTKFLTANRAVLIESGAVTEEEFARLQSGTMGFSRITLPAGIALMQPGTTLAGQFVNNLLHPYGMTDSPQEMLSDYTPRVLSNMARTMGLWLNDGEDGQTMWLWDTLMGPTGRSGMGTYRAEALIWLEMQGGHLTRQGEIAEKMNALEKDSSEWLALNDELNAIDEFITEEIKHIATSRSFMAGMFQVMAPFSPRMPTESQTLKAQYSQGRMVAEQWAEGNPMPLPFDGQNAQDAWSMVASWAADKSGGFAKQEFLNQHGGKSSILAAIVPRTYWGGTGLPVWATDMRSYFAGLESGDILPLPIDVLRYKIRSMNIQVEREMVLIEEFGNDPEGQALAMLENGAHAKEITELFDEKWKALEMEDELVNGGAWAKYSLDVADNFVDFAYNENQEILDALSITQELLDLELFPDDPQEAKQVRGTLIGIAESAYAAADVYNDGRYADWEVSPRQKIFNEYWEAYGDYTTELSKQYEGIEGLDTEREVSMAYDDVARFVANEGSKPFIIQGKAYPSASARNWGNLDREHQSAQADAKLSGKMEWLSPLDVEHIVDVYPEAAPYLPTSQAAKDIFAWKANQDALLARRWRIGGDFIELKDGSGTRRDKHQTAINEEFERKLRGAKEFGVLEALSFYPAMNFNNYKALPKELEWFVPYAFTVWRQLDAIDKSPLSNVGKVQQRHVLARTLELFDANPLLRDPFIQFGQRVFQESTVEGIVAQLLGNYKGDME